MLNKEGVIYTENMERESKTCLRVLEFYSGIGGMRFSLNQSGIQATVVEAFDINNIANEVYKHNFGHSPYQGNIQSLTAAQLDKFKADAWLLSPPCQPYTRQGLQKDANDARASSFLNLIELIPTLIFPPSFLFLENVVGFESSITHGKMMDVLEQNGFTTQEFIFTPLQFGIPYSRPRYFCLAKRAPFLFQSQELNGRLVFDVAPLMQKKVNCLNEKKLVDAGEECERDECLDTSASCKSVKDFIEVDVFGFDSEGSPRACNIAEEEMLVEEGNDTFEDLPTKKNLISEDREIDQGIYSVPLQLIERWGDAMDIVFPNSKRCCCFTKSYGRYVKGTGSFLAIHKESPNTPFIGERTQNHLMQKKSFIQDLYVRYFTPREIANFHSFPDDFSFPSHVSQRQRYALLGNSISVAVVAPLLTYLFTTQCTDF